ncbi:hypothetical protein JCM11641_001870 [Rhodosporidiobolus odoratus]
MEETFGLQQLDMPKRNPGEALDNYVLRLVFAGNVAVLRGADRISNRKMDDMAIKLQNDTRLAGADQLKCAPVLLVGALASGLALWGQMKIAAGIIVALFACAWALASGDVGKAYLRGKTPSQVWTDLVSLLRK